MRRKRRNATRDMRSASLLMRFEARPTSLPAVAFDADSVRITTTALQIEVVRWAMPRAISCTR